MSRSRIHHRPCGLWLQTQSPARPPLRRRRHTSNTLGVGAHLDLPPIGTTSTGTLQLRLGRTIPTVLSVPALGSLCAFACSSYEGVRGSMQDRHAVPKIRETAHHGSCYGTAGNQHTDTLAQRTDTMWQGSKLDGAEAGGPRTLLEPVCDRFTVRRTSPRCALPATYRHVTALFFVISCSAC